VYIFKTDKGPERWTVRLRGLDAGVSYHLEFADGTNPATECDGRELAEKGIEIVLRGKHHSSELMFVSPTTRN
jgi:hypothetical protein